MKNSKKVSLMVILLLVLTLPMSAMAHGGRTDGAGGHKDNKNASGLGYYHYHCGGNPPHLHSGGGCPYSYSPAPVKSSTKPAPVKAPTYNIKPQEYMYNNNSANIKSFVHKDRTYIAAADLSDLIGGSANYDKSIKTVTISSPATYKTASFAVDNKVAIMTNDRTYVPLRSAIETMGYTVNIVDGVMVLAS